MAHCMVTLRPTVWSPASGEAPVLRVSGVAEDAAWEAQLALQNPTSGVMWVDLVPVGPALDFMAPHDRGRFGG